MRILHVINSLAGSGGAEHGLVREVVELADEHDQLVVRMFEPNHLEQALRRRGVMVRSLGLESANAGWNWPVGVDRLLSVIREFQPEILHSSLFSGNLVCQIAGRISRLPVVSTFTLSGDVRLLRSYQPGAASARASVLRRIAAMAASSPGITFRALTEDALETNCRLLRIDPRRCRVIPRGIPNDLRPTPLKTRAQLGLPDGIPLLVNVGRQTAQKGHPVLIEVFRRILAHEDAHLVIVGREGDSSRQIKGLLSEYGLEERVTLTGYTPDVFHYLCHAEVFVFPSFMEGLGTAVLEAMSLGVPVVASDIPPIREITNDGALARLVPAGDAAAFAIAVEDALTMNRDVVSEARNWVDERYSIGAVTKRLDQLLRAAAMPEHA